MIFIVYRDTATPTPFIEPFLQSEETAKPDHIYLDSSAFGTATCLQVKTAYLLHSSSTN